MSIPARSVAQSETDTTYDAIVAAANAQFIAEVEVLINQAIEQGKYNLHLTTPPNVDPMYVNTYFFNLGYTISFPDALTINGQPAQLFGELYEQWWNNGGIPKIQSPTRVIINWQNPLTPFPIY